MFGGIGIIGALASILASMLVSPATPDESVPAVDATTTSAIVAELAGLRAEVAALRAAIGNDGS